MNNMKHMVLLFCGCVSFTWLYYKDANEVTDLLPKEVEKESIVIWQEPVGQLEAHCCCDKVAGSTVQVMLPMKKNKESIVIC